MHNFKKIILHSLLLTAFVIILSFSFLLPYFYTETYHYQDYKVRKALSGSIDTLVIGSSHAVRSVKPTVLKEELGINAYNLSSPLMSMYGRYVLLKKEIERNPIDTVYLELSFNALTLDKDILGFEGDIYVLGRLDTNLERIKFFKSAFTKDEYGKILTDTIRRSKYAMENSLGKKEPIAQYETYGYLPIESKDQLMTEEVKKKIYNSKPIDAEIKDYNLANLEKMVELCKDNDVNLVFIVTPITEILLIQYSNLDEVFSQYEQLAKKYDCEYYDFNLDKQRPKIYSEKTSFYDNSHMSDSGADIFSKRFADIIKDVNEGKDVSNEFYKTYGELKEVMLKRESF